MLMSPLMAILRTPNILSSDVQPPDEELPITSRSVVVVVVDTGSKVNCYKSQKEAVERAVLIRLIGRVTLNRGA